MGRRLTRIAQDVRSRVETATEPLKAEIVAPSASQPEIDHLTLKQRLFVEAYIGRCRGNATESARVAGYSGDDNVLGTTGFALVRNPKVSEEIARRRKELVASISAERLVLSALEEAEATLEDFIDVDPDGRHTVNLAKAKLAGKLHLIEDLQHDKETGAPIVKLPSRKAAREFIAKMLGLGKEQAPQGAPPVTVQIYQHLQSLPTEDIKRLREEQKQLTKGEG